MIDSFDKHPLITHKQVFFFVHLHQREQELDSFGALPPNQQEALIGLTQMTGIGAGLAHRLLTRFGCAISIFAASEKELLSVEGIGHSLAKRITKGFDRLTAQHQLEQINRLQLRVFVVGSPDYPASLLRLSDPPTLLFLSGTTPPNWEPKKFVAVVGTRQADRRGIHLTNQTVKTLVEHGYTVVSGGALGIDTAAHSAALAYNGHTLAIVATGLDRDYPSQNRRLFRDIRQKGGAILSEWLPGTMPEKGFFPRRNRLISALCNGVVVVQCSAKSGALNTATHAKRIGVPIYTFPGRPQETLAAGPHQLLRKGAQLIESGQELIQYLQNPSEEPTNQQLSLWHVETTSPTTSSSGQTQTQDIQSSEKRKETDKKLKMLDPLAQQIYAVLHQEKPLHIDEIASQTKCPVSQVSSHLLHMELEGLLVAHSGMYFTRI